MPENVLFLLSRLRRLLFFQNHQDRASREIPENTFASPTPLQLFKATLPRLGLSSLFHISPYSYNYLDDMP